MFEAFQPLLTYLLSGKPLANYSCVFVDPDVGSRRHGSDTWPGDCRHYLRREFTGVHGKFVECLVVVEWMLVDNAIVLRDVDSLVIILFVMSCVFVDVPLGEEKMGIHTRECFLRSPSRRRIRCLSNWIQSIGSLQCSSRILRKNRVGRNAKLVPWLQSCTCASTSIGYFFVRAKKSERKKGNLCYRVQCTTSNEREPP